MTRSVLLLLVCTMGGLGGCDAGPEASESGPGETGKADDLVGRRVTIRGTQPVMAAIPGAMAVTPTVNEIDATSVELQTRDIRLAAPAPGQTVRVLIETPRDDFEDYAFQLEYRDPATGEWRATRPTGSFDFYWDLVMLTNEGDQVRVEGEARRITDWLGGVGALVDYSHEETLIPAGVTELRVLAIPIWNFWEWDSTGYFTRVIFR